MIQFMRTPVFAYAISKAQIVEIPQLISASVFPKQIQCSTIPLRLTESEISNLLWLYGLKAGFLMTRLWIV